MNMLFFAIFAVVCMLGFSFYISRPNWPYHPGAAKGYITDMLIYFFLPVVPMLVCLGGYNLLRMFVPAADIESDTARYVMMAIALVGLFATRRLPFVLAAQKRVMEARNARYQAGGPQA